MYSQDFRMACARAYSMKSYRKVAMLLGVSPAKMPRMMRVEFGNLLIFLYKK